MRFEVIIDSVLIVSAQKNNDASKTINKAMIKVLNSAGLKTSKCKKIEDIPYPYQIFYEITATRNRVGPLANAILRYDFNLKFEIDSKKYSFFSKRLLKYFKELTNPRINQYEINNIK